jgi:hypothetical protein
VPALYNVQMFLLLLTLLHMKPNLRSGNVSWTYFMLHSYQQFPTVKLKYLYSGHLLSNLHIGVGSCLSTSVQQLLLSMGKVVILQFGVKFL